MKFRGIQLTALWDSITVTDTYEAETIHYPGSDVNEENPLGQGATTINCILFAKGETERRLIIGLMKGRTHGELTIGSTFYKQVVPGLIIAQRKVYNETWHIQVSFVALDPQEYDVVTGEVAY